MSRRRKLRKIEEAMTLPNVFQPEAATCETWRVFFGNENPIILELGCGTGAYTVGLAELFPEYNYIGVDIKGARIWQGAKTALAKKLTNVAFLRIGIEDIEKYFAPKSISEIWITFPDPFPKKKQAKNRLTSPLFLERYKKILQPGGRVHLKTDDTALFEYTRETVKELGCGIEDIQTDVPQKTGDLSPLYIQTTYEQRHRAAGKKIYYLRWKFIPSTK